MQQDAQHANQVIEAAIRTMHRIYKESFTLLDRLASFLKQRDLSPAGPIDLERREGLISDPRSWIVTRMYRSFGRPPEKREPEWESGALALEPGTRVHFVIVELDREDARLAAPSLVAGTGFNFKQIAGESKARRGTRGTSISLNSWNLKDAYDGLVLGEPGGPRELEFPKRGKVRFRASFGVEIVRELATFERMEDIEQLADELRKRWGTR